MPKLTRLRLVSVGRPQARFGDVTLKFCDAQGNADDTMLWLRNGGGKSSILGLFFALMRPHDRDFLGAGERRGEARRHIGNYVLPGDRSVVVAEWQMDESDTPLFDREGEVSMRYLTGVFYERQDASEGGVPRVFFATKVVPQEPRLTLDGLPLYKTLRHEGKARYTLAEFKQEWNEAGKHPAHPETKEEESQTRWTKVLEDARLYPDLFKCQVAMNRREGGTAESFRFVDDDAFVDFFLELTMEPEDFEQVAANLNRFSEGLRVGIEQLRPELDLAAGLITRLDPLIQVAAEREKLRQRQADAALEMSELILWLGRRITEMKADGEKERQALEQLNSQVEQADQDARRLRSRAMAFRLRNAHLELDNLIAEGRKAEAAMKDAERVMAIWEAAVPLREILDCAEEIQGYRAQIARLQGQHQPSYRALQAAAAAFAGALRADAEAKRSEEATYREQAFAAYGRAKSDLEAAARFSSEIAAHGERAASLQRLVGAADQARGELQSQEVLREGETLDAAFTRLVGQHAETEQKIVNSLLAVKQQRATLEGFQQEDAAAERDEALAQEHESVWRDRDESAQQERRFLEDQEVLRSCLETEEKLDLDVLDMKVLSARLREAMNAARRKWFEELRLAEESDQIVRALNQPDKPEEPRLLPPSRDVTAILDMLGKEPILAWTGWDCLREYRYTPSRIQHFVARAPEFAQGVIVPDDDLERARTVLARQQAEGHLQLETWVVITTQSAVLAVGNSDDNATSQICVVGPDGDARFDPAAARRLHALRDHQSRERHRVSEGAAELWHELAALDVRLESFRARYPLGWFADAQRDLQRLHADQQTIAQRRLTLAARMMETRRQLGQEETVGKDRQEHANRLSDALVCVRTHIQIHGADLSSLEQQIASAQTAANFANAAFLRLGDAVAAAEKLMHDHFDSACLAAGRACLLEYRWRAVGYLDGEPAATPGSTEQLGRSYQLLESEYHERLGASELDTAVQRAQSRQATARGRMSVHFVKGVDESSVRTALGSLVGPAIETRRRHAASSFQLAQNIHSGFSGQIDNATTRLGNLQQKSQQEKILPVGWEATAPWPDDLEAAAAEADRLASVAEGEKTASEKEREATAARSTSASTLRTRFENQSARLTDLRENTEDVLGSTTGTPLTSKVWQAPNADQAEERISSLREQIGSIRLSRGEVDRSSHDAIGEIFRWAEVPRFAKLPSVLPRKIEVNRDTLESGAAALREEFALRVKTTEGRLSEHGKHRDLIIQELLAVAERGSDSLKYAAARSKFPDELSTLAGRRFLQISLGTPEQPAERHARMGEYVDEMVRMEEVPTGLKLIQGAVRRLVRPAKIKVFFPDLDQAPSYFPVSQLPVKSGGEQLTCAVLLYCTLLQVRARRDGKGLRPTGVLLLDNPVGSSSRPKFLALQKAVANAMGVQLIYTTAVNDLEAIGTLPTVIRLRNERQDQRTGYRHVEVVSTQPEAGPVIEAAHLVLPTRKNPDGL